MKEYEFRKHHLQCGYEEDATDGPSLSIESHKKTHSIKRIKRKDRYFKVTFCPNLNTYWEEEYKKIEDPKDYSFKYIEIAGPV